MKYLAAIGIFAFSFMVNAAPSGDCRETPKEAIVDLPEPLNSWGQLLCTPYGHIITNKVGWVWSNPGSYSPVMIPSQMVRSEPELLGNKSYFTKIEMVALSETESDAVVKTFESHFDKSKIRPQVYSLIASSISGKELGFRFLDYGDSIWGMWCNKECNPDSKFMLLNMEKSLLRNTSQVIDCKKRN